MMGLPKPRLQINRDMMNIWNKKEILNNNFQFKEVI